VICIDAGHGGSDPGKVGDPDILEKDINLSLALKLQKVLEKNNFKVYMTRNGDYNLADSKDNQKRSDLANRKQIIFENDPSAVISIHQNSYPSSDVHGAQVFYPQGSEKSKLLADSIQDALIQGLDSSNHRQAKSNAEYYLFRDNPYPIVIVECGFLSNPEELKLLQSSSYQKKAAQCIYQGLKNYLDGRN
jgi:N-acetylmuramoyl-L-alanine amidase